MKWIKRIPPLAAAFYLLCVAANGAYVFYRYEFAPENGEFAAFGLVVLTLPWSLYLEPVVGGGPDDSASGAVVRFALYGLANAAIIYAAFALVWRLAGINRLPAA